MATYSTTRAATIGEIPANFQLDPAVDEPNIDAFAGPFAVRSGTYSNIVPTTLNAATTTVSGQTYTVSASSVQGTNHGYLAFDTSAETKRWATSAAPSAANPQWVQIVLSTAVSIAGYKFNKGSSIETMPFNFTLQACNVASPTASTTWTTIDTQSGKTQTSFDTKFAMITDSYTTYRLLITRNNDANSNTFINGFNLYTFSGTLALTKQDQLVQIYTRYKTANDNLASVAAAAAFKPVYEAARRFITDAELASATITTRQAVYTDGTYTLDEITKARRDIMQTVIAKYFLYNPTGGTLSPSVVPASSPSSSPSTVPAPSAVTSLTTADQLTTLESTYLTGASALWPPLLNRIRSTVTTYIGTYKTTRTSAGITSGANFYDNAACDTDISGIVASNFNLLNSNGDISYGIGSASVSGVIPAFNLVAGGTTPDQIFPPTVTAGKFSFTTLSGTGYVSSVLSSYSGQIQLVDWPFLRYIFGRCWGGSALCGNGTWPGNALLFEFPYPINATILNFRCSANNVQFAISGSNNGTTWTLISSPKSATRLYPNANANQISASVSVHYYTYTFTNTTYYKYYKIDGNSSYSSAIIELELQANVYPSYSLSEFSYISDIYSRYQTATNGILASARSTAESARSSFQTLYTTTFSNCNPPTSSNNADLQAAITNYSDDVARINSAATFTDANTYRDRYRNAIAALFLQERTDQIAFANKYITLYNKYISFRTDSTIGAYNATIAVPPATIPATDVNVTGPPTNATSTLNTLNLLPTTFSGASQPNSDQIGTLQTFCNNYGGNSGYYATLVSHIRTNLGNFIVKYDAAWNALSTAAKAAFSYTSPLVSGSLPASTTDVELYNYMNSYAGFAADSLVPVSGPPVAASPTYAATFSAAKTQADALTRINDFGNIYTAVLGILGAKTDNRMAGITTLIGNAATANTVTYITTIVSSNPATALSSAATVVNGATFAQIFTNLVALAQDNLNAILAEYLAVYNAYGTFRTAFSGIAELPTLAALSSTYNAPTWSGASGPMTGLAYNAPASGTYTSTTANGLTLHGSLTNYSTFADYVTNYATKFQSLVAQVQGAVNSFRTTVLTKITTLPTVRTGSATGDNYSTSITQSGNAKSDMTSLGNAIVTWYMKTYLVDTWNAGRRYLSDSAITTDMSGFVVTCRKYIQDSDGFLKSTPLVLTTPDTLQSLMSTAATALRDSSKALATGYNAAWTKWVTGGRIKTPTATLPANIADDMIAGTDAVRTNYLARWETLMGDIKGATKTFVSATKEVNDWLRGTGAKTVGTMATTGLGQP
jgi:hypothetical protein